MESSTLHQHAAAQVILSDSAPSARTLNTLLLNELPRFNGLALQMIWNLLGTFSCLHQDLASDMEQLFHSFAQQVSPRQAGGVALTHTSSSSSSSPALPQLPQPPCLLEVGGVCGAGRCEEVGDAVSRRAGDPQRTCGPGEGGAGGTGSVVTLRTSTRLCLQPLSPSSRRRLKQLTDKHGSGQIYQVTGAVAAGRDLDLSLARGELVAVLSEADTRGDRRRWLVDAGGETAAPSEPEPEPAPDPSPSRCVYGLQAGEATLRPQS